MSFTSLFTEYWIVIILLMVWYLAAYNVAFIRNPVAYWQRSAILFAASWWVFVSFFIFSGFGFSEDEMYYLFAGSFFWQIVLGILNPQRTFPTYTSFKQFMTFQKPTFISQQHRHRTPEAGLWVPSAINNGVDLPKSFNKPANIPVTLLIEACILGTALIGFIALK